MKRRITIALAALLTLVLAGCGGEKAPETAQAPLPAAAAEPDPNPPAASREPMTATPTAMPTPTPTPEPTPFLRPGEYVGSDGSVLTVNADGTCDYEVTVSGTINGKAMSGRLTFYGTVDNGAFSFTKVMYFGLDLTAIAKSAGYEDASYWEKAAAIIYAGG